MEIPESDISGPAPAKNEKNLKVQSIHIRILDDGSFLYRVDSEKPGAKGLSDTLSQSYSAKSVDDVIGLLKDDLGSPHMKKVPSDRVDKYSVLSKGKRRIFS